MEGIKGKEEKSWKEEIVSYENLDCKKENQIWVDKVSVSYYQSGDCTESKDDCQKMTVSSRNNGMARFVNIKTDKNGWSIDSPDGIKMVLEDFCKRAGIEGIC